MAETLKREHSVEGCPFCDRIAHDEYEAAWLGAVMFEPLDPVTPGHRLFVSREHESPLADRFDYYREPRNVPRGVGDVMPLLQMWRHENDITEQFNLILNAGEHASQTIEHLHLHYIPRRPGDGLVLPWTYQIRNAAPVTASAEDSQHCGRGVCSAPEGHDGTCAEASGWAEFDLRMLRRFPAECTEAVSRKHELQQCGKPAVAARMDTDADRPYPVCAYHSRAPMVPLTALLTEGARR